MTQLAAGFAAAVSPVTAETITTDGNGLTAGEVTIPTDDGQMPGDLSMMPGDLSMMPGDLSTMPGYRAMPHEGAKFPMV